MWDDERKWTLILSFLIPLVAIGLVSELLYFLMNHKLSNLSVLLCASFTGFINEYILKPACDQLPYKTSTELRLAAPASSIAIPVAITIIYLIRLIKKVQPNLLALISWAVIAVLTFIARPLLYYLSWTYAAISLVPGVVIGIFWGSLLELKYIENTLSDVSGILGIENDLVSGGYQKEQDLLPE